MDETTIVSSLQREKILIAEEGFKTKSVPMLFLSSSDFISSALIKDIIS